MLHTNLYRFQFFILIVFVRRRPRYVPVPSIERSPRELLQIVSCLHKGGCKSFSGIQSKLLRKAGRFDL
eukprot:jgi/Botrbrau1/7891/Bobra.9_2s0064.1